MQGCKKARDTVVIEYKSLNPLAWSEQEMILISFLPLVS